MSSRHPLHVIPAQAGISHSDLTRARDTGLHRLTVATNNWKAPREQWAGEKAPVRRNVFLLHYAGSWRPSDADRHFYQLLARFGIKVGSPGVRRALPHKRLWKRYRYFRYAKPAAGK